MPAPPPDLTAATVSLTTGLRVFFPFACGYFLSYLYRTVNAIIAPDLIATAGLDASALGLLTSVYFLTFAACQLPLGMLLDRFGARRIESLLLLVAALGACMFALAQDLNSLLLGRALIGIGVSGCLMAAFQAFVLRFPKPRLPFLNGCMMACGGAGALVATAPVEALLHFTDWRGLFTILAILTVVVSGVIFWTVPEPPGDRSEAHISEPLHGVALVFRDAHFWRLAPITMLAHATLLSLQGLWIGPWLRDVAKLERPAVATHLLVAAAAMLMGYLVMGALGERFQQRGVNLTRVAGVGIAAFMSVQVLICLNVKLSPILLWPLFSFFGASSILPFAILSQAFPSHLAGRLNTALNLLIFLAAFGAQYGIGAIINLWPATPSGGYEMPAYRASFGLTLTLQLLAFLWFLRPQRLPRRE